MTLTNNLRTQVDLPIYEWCKFCPVTAVAGASMCSPDNLSGRYIYYQNTSAVFYRYDTWSDSWQQLATPAFSQSSPAAMSYNAYHGYTGHIISATSTTFTGAGIYGNILANAFSGNSFNPTKVRIISGTGAGQERTISSVAKTVIADNGILTGAFSTTLVDSTKNWATNQWVGYQIRFTFGQGNQQVRKILWNNNTTISHTEPGLSYGDTQSQVYLNNMNAAGGVQYVIESSVFTISSAWSITPDNTSKFTVLTGGIWLLTAGSSANYGLYYYDVAADVWYTKSNQSNIMSASTALINTDISIKCISESGGSWLSSTATSGGNFTLTDSTQTLTTNRYANYLIKITGGTGIGQTRTILAHTATVFTVVRVWDVNPDSTSTYTIYGDYDKIYIVGNGNSTMYQYSVEADQLVTGRIYDWGTARSGACVLAGVNQQAVPISTITSTGTTASVTTPYNLSLINGQTVTFTGCTGTYASNYNITATISLSNSTAFNYTIVSTGGVSATLTAQSTTTLVDCTKNWATNSLVGMLVSYQTGLAANPTGNTTNVIQQITANNATTLTFATSTAPLNGASRYVIYDPKSFGIESSPGSLNPTTANYGTASSGSTTTLVDSSKSWATSQWNSRRVQIFAGTGAGNIMSITATSSTTLTYATQTFTPDTTTQYRIIDGFGYATSAVLTQITDSNQFWSTNILAGKCAKITSGTGVGQEGPISSNNNTQFTVSGFTVQPDSTSTYCILQPSVRGAGTGLIWAWGISDATTDGSYLISIRSGGASNGFDIYNITTEQWKLLTISTFVTVLGTGTYYCYDGGNRMYFTDATNNRLFYYDIINNTIVISTSFPGATGGQTAIGNRMELIQTVDGLQYIYTQKNALNEFIRVPISW